jgi:superfamily II DNA or RNA helicase
MTSPSRTNLSRRGYGLLKSEFDYKILNELRKKFTVSPNVASMGGFGEPSQFSIYIESSKRLYIPKAYGLREFGIPDDDKMSDGVKINHNIKFSKTLYPTQIEPVNKYLEAARDPLQRGALFPMFPGAGKTCCALYCVGELRVKTLVIVHQEFLMEQWKDRIESFLPGSSVGTLQGKIIDVEGHDIVIGMLQSLSMKDYDSGIFDDFGMVIIDECHHLGAEIFSQALRHVNFRYAMGLSGTMTRKDGLSKVFRWTIGEPAFKTISRKKEDVHVHIHEYYNHDSRYSKEEELYNRKPNTARMINNICYFQPRTENIVNIITQVKHDTPSRNIILLSDRREHLKTLKKLLDDLIIGNESYPIIKVGYYVGGMKKNELKDTENTCDVILATFSMAAEGLDLPKLDTIVLASPKSDVKQATGRILRKKKEDRTNIPLIIDIHDQFSCFERQGNKRLTYYNKCSYTIETFQSQLSRDRENEAQIQEKIVTKRTHMFRSKSDE